jgi:hypothetical protein
MKEFSRNETVSLMHRNTANSIRALVDHAKKFKYKKEQIYELLLDIADELEAQAIVVELRDKL